MSFDSPRQTEEAGTPAPGKVDPRQRNHWPIGAWIAVGSLGVILLVVVTVFVTVLAIGNNESRDVAATTPDPSPAAPSTPASPPAPAIPSETVAPVEPSTEVIPLGSPIVSPNYSLVINSVEVLDQIDTVSGTPIVAPAGTKLVLVRSTIAITGNAQDLTCGSSIFMQAHDSMGAEMSHVFEGPEIPGNPQCNYKRDC